MTIHPGIKLRHLRIFLSVVEHRSISGAAERLGVSQPVISKAIRDLEALVKVPLLERGARGITPTAKGETFADHAARAIKSLEAGALAIEDNPPGRITVGLLPTVAGGFFPSVALPFNAARPSTRMTVITGSQTHLLQELRAARIDLMLGRMPDPSDMPGLRFDWLYDEDVLTVARAGHPAASDPVQEALRRYPLILPPENAAIRRTVDDFLASLDLIEPNVPFQTVSLSPAIRLLELSDMIWFISRGVVQRELERHSLHVWPTEARYLSGAVGITRRSGGRDRPEVADLCAAFQAEAKARAVS